MAKRRVQGAGDFPSPAPATPMSEDVAGRRESVLLAHEDAFACLLGEFFDACAGEAGWPAKLVAATGAALDFAAREPERARLLFFDISPADPELIPPIQASTDYMMELLRHGRRHCPEGVVLPDSMERILIGGASSIVLSRLLAGQASRLPALKPPLVQFLLTPYLGLERARGIASTVG